jgi:1,2-diacylglycerol 3-beta-glucosyltransferase
VAVQLRLPFEGLPAIWVGLFSVALLVIVAMLCWTGVLFLLAQRARRHPPTAAEGGPDRFTWVFLVPALNEEVTIRDSVQRLLDLDLDRRRIVVIDDASDDRTPEILGALEHTDLVTLRREPPNARQGKAAALNHAYRALGRVLAGADRRNVIVAVVDADGRLHPDAPRYAASHFAEPCVGGVQSLVRIYNRRRFLTWMQDVEFSVYGSLFQGGRDAWGTAGMGGNGQFNRLEALDAVADRDGPWGDRLTEDQDIGLRLIAAGWAGRQDLRAVVDQQGLPRLRPLFRQRARWSQGNLQAMSLIGEVWRAPTPFAARIDLIAYLLMPFWQGLVGAALVVALVLGVTGESAFWDVGDWWELAFIYVLGFGGTMLGCIAGRLGRGDDAAGVAVGILIAHVYAFYSWLLWPVLARATFRQLTDKRNWAKTQREPIAVSSAGG